jgi:ribonuclease Y
MVAVYILIGLLLGGGAAAFYFFVLRKRETQEMMGARTRAEGLVLEAEKKAEEVRKEAHLEAREVENRAHEYENETRQRRLELQQVEQRLLKREESIERKGDLLASKEGELQGREKKIQDKEKSAQTMTENYERLVEQGRKELERIAGMSAEEARQALVGEMVAEARLQAARDVKSIEDEARDRAEANSKNIIASAISRYAGEFVAEQVVTVVNLPNEEMKGRIIGREGRNIRAFEAATGVDLIIDDTPDAVVVSGFSSVRREVARLSLEKLISDGRIHPSRIEEIVKKCEAEVDTLIKQAGEKASMELNVYGLHAELVKYLGRLRYRTSYGQNVLAHSVEVAFIAGLLAGELNQNVKIARRAGLLHDIGKAADQEQEGPHHIVGCNLAKKFGESAQVVQAIRAHHEQPESILDHILIAADAISGARPGARRELLETYVKRLDDLEALSKSFKGVDEAYAFQAGREIRVLVRPDQVSDEELSVLAHDIAAKIEQDLTYPGRIKVAVIRQTRVEATAK